MRIKSSLPLFVSLFVGMSSQLLGIQIPVNCNGKVPLQTVIDLALPGTTLILSGTCSGPIVINRGNLTLESRSGAIIDGQKKDAITVNGAANVTLGGLDIRNGANGILANSGAHLIVVNTDIHDNTNMGILLIGNSSVALYGGSTKKNAVNGIDAEASSAVVISGSYTAEANRVFGLNINGASSLTLTKANLLADENTLGIQIGTSASAFILDPETTITVKNNAATGLTIVS